MQKYLDYFFDSGCNMSGMALWLGRTTLVPRVEGSSYGPDLLQKV